MLLSGVGLVGLVGLGLGGPVGLGGGGGGGLVGRVGGLVGGRVGGLVGDGWVFLSSLLAVWLAWWAGVPLVQVEVAQVVLVQVRLEEELVGLAAPPRARQAPPLQGGAAGSWAS